MKSLLFLLALPLLYWQQGIESAPALKQAGIERLCVPPDQADAWRRAGFSPVPMSLSELEAREKLLTPRLGGRVDVASATRRPWIDSNGWRFVRDPSGKFYYDLPPGRAALAAAEAFAYGADAVLKIDPADLEAASRMFAFLRELPNDPLPPVADMAVVDDGSPLTGEVMNLLTRRNLLFQVVTAPSPKFRLNIRLGTKEYPKADAADPSAFAQKIRRQLTDENRSLRVYGTELVICRLAGDGSRVRLHLLNYGGRDIDSLRVRLSGSFARGEAFAAGYDSRALEDFVVADGATEFSIPRMGVYAMVELRRAK
ncbi:MAG TPA: hypothetical protein VFD58_35450 [Blastocatellia bacterium]|nr:hypothetical protein [Blastocatellia bacterium]